MKRNTFVWSMALVLSMCSGTARAQFGYGYGGWGGWGGGGTAQGSMARGMGMFNMGAGMYNMETAQARSINVDTAMRWNAAVWQGQMVKNRMYQATVRAGQERANRLGKEIQDRLRNHPETRDITDGDALNAMLDILLNPAVVDRALQYIKTPLRHDVIANIPFEAETEGMTVCLDSMTMDGQWPIALRDEAFRPEREALRKAVQVALKEDEKGNLEPETVNAVGTALKDLRIKFEKLVPTDNPDYIPARDSIKAMAGLTKMLDSSKMEKVLAELEDYQGTTLGDLLGFMHAFNLRFAPANSYRQKQIYTRLYPMLAEQANGSLGSLARGGYPGAGGAADSLGNKAVADTESARSKSTEELKAAATDLFKGMGWEHLSGGSSPAPATAPAQP